MTERRTTIGDHAFGLTLCIVYVAVLMATASDLGMSRDESFYVHAAQDYGGWFSQLLSEPRVAMERSFLDSAWDYNWEHPPLMKSAFAASWLLHKRLDLFGSESMAFRFPGMLTAGLLLWLIYIWATRVFGRTAGVFAALAYALMPRPFYHAHLNCFDVPITLMIVWVTYAYWRSLSSRRWAWITGIAFGFALATKHNSWVLPGIFAIHFAWLHLRPNRTTTLSRIPWWLIAMVIIGPLIFLSTWPWLWHDTWARISNYVGFHLRHDYYNIAYFGKTYFEPPFPVSYPFVMTAITVPLTTLALALLGLITRAARIWPFGEQEDDRSTDILLLGSLLAPLVIIALPTSPIFGGTKHWMPAYPFVAMYAGAAFALVATTLSTKSHAWATTLALGAVLLTPSFVEAKHSHPFGLSHYTPIAGGPPGAADLGMNRQFWGFTTGSLVPWLKAKLPEGGSVWPSDTTWGAWTMLQRDGHLPKNIRATANLSRADLVLVHHEDHFAEIEFQSWVAFNTTQPAYVLRYNGVPIITVYERR